MTTDPPVKEPDKTPEQEEKPPAQEEPVKYYRYVPGRVYLPPIEPIGEEKD